MAPQKQSSIVLALGIVLGMALIGYGRGVEALAQPQAFLTVCVIALPIAVLALASFVGPNKRAGRGAASICWVFLIFELLILWNIVSAPGKSTDAIGVGILVIVQVFAALSILVAAIFQKVEVNSGASNDAT